MNLPKGIAHFIEHNDHVTIYENVTEEYMANCEFREGKEIAPGELPKILATGELWVVRWYPDTPVGSCVAVASTLEAALEWANTP